MRRVFAVAVLLSALAASWAWYEFWFRWRNCFNDEGRCFDAASGVVHHAQTGLPLGLLALGLFALAVFLFRRAG